MTAARLDAHALGADHHVVAGERHRVVDFLGQLGLLQMQVHHFRGQVLGVGGLGVEVVEHRGGGLHRPRVAGQMKQVAAVADVHLQAVGDLLDMLVETAAQAGQTAGVVGFKTDLLGSGWCVQVGRDGPWGSWR